MDVSICVLTHSQPQILPKCIASCFAEIGRSGPTGEVILIDNASSNGSPKAVKERFPNVRVIRNEQNLGFSAANNMGVRFSRGRYVLILNDDAILKEGSLRLMVQKLESDASIAAVGPKLLNPDGSLQEGFTHRRFPNIIGIACLLLRVERFLRKRPLARDLLTLDRDMNRSGEAEHLAGACLLVRREAWDMVAGFDEWFHYTFEDTDLCYRLKKAGWVVFYVAGAEVVHYGSASIGKLARTERAGMFFRSMIYFFKKHSSPLRYLSFRIILAAIFTLRATAAILVAVFRRGWTRQQRNDLVGSSLSVLRAAAFERPKGGQ